MSQNILINMETMVNPKSPLFNDSCCPCICKCSERTFQITLAANGPPELCAINILKLVNDMQRETYPLLYSGKTSI